MKKKILITGSNGFIGSNLVKFLKERDDYFLCEVDLQHGFDLSKPGWSQKIPEKEIDTVVHLAQSLQYRNFPDGAMDMCAVNIGSTVELLDWSYRHHVKRFLFASTGNVYRASQEKVDEESPCDPVSMYASSKYSAERIILHYQKLIDVVIFRLFGIYGPGQKSMIVPTMIEKVRTGEKITLAQNQGIYLTPLYIKDCILYIYRFIHEDYDHDIKIINLAGTREVSLRNMVDFLGENLGVKPNVEITQDTPQRFCGTTKYSSIHLQNYVDFEEGLRKTLQHTSSRDLK
jgi:UDP-glucose 4-epimerase